MCRTKRIRSAIVLVALLTLTHPGKAGATEFASPKSYPVGKNPAAAALADFNGDGRLDIVVANTGSNDVSVLLGRGDGTFEAAANFDVGLIPTLVVVGDFNGDGKMDIAAFQAGDNNSALAGAASVLLGNGNGTFQVPKATTLTVSAAGMVAGDFNSDKKTDLIVTNSDASTGAVTLEILIANGDGTFQAPKTVPLGPGSGPAISIATADFNGDNSSDVVVIAGQKVILLLGNGDGSFQPAREIAATNSNPFLVIADENGDGKFDLLINSFIPKDPNCTDFCEQPDVINIYYGNGDGTFTAGATVLLNLFGGAGGRFVAADFNADGKLDLFTGFRLLLGQATGKFQSIPGEFPNLFLLFAADLNGDKLSDLVYIDGPNNSVVVQLNTSPTTGADIAVLNATAESLAPPIEAIVGEQTSYDLDFYNEGPQDASDVVVTETLAAGMQFVSASLDSCSGTSVVTCHLGPTVEPSLTTISITVIPTVAGILTDSTKVSATPTDLNPGNDSASITFSAALPVALSLTASASESVAIVGDQIKIMAEASNAGPGTVTNLALQDTITQMFPVSSLTISQGSCALDTSVWQINCAIGTLAPGTTVRLGFIITPSAPTPMFNNIFTATSDQASILDNGTNPVVSITVNSKPDFTIIPASTSLALQPGTSASDVLNIAAVSSFADSVQLTCSVVGASPAPTCGISPQSVTPGNSATLTVNASGLSALAWPSFDGTPTLGAIWRASALSFTLIACFWAAAFDKKRRYSKTLCVLALAVTTLLAACGGGGAALPPASKKFTVTVTATSGAIQHSANINVTVN